MNRVDFLIANPPDSDDENDRRQPVTPRFGSTIEDIEYTPLLLLPEIDVFPPPDLHAFPQPGDSIHDRVAALINLPRSRTHWSGEALAIFHNRHAERMSKNISGTST